MPMTVEHRSPGAIDDNTMSRVTTATEHGLSKHSLIPFYWSDVNDVGIANDTKILFQVLIL